MQPLQSSRQVTWALAGLIVLLCAILGWTLLRWQRAERQMQVAQQRAAEAEYARELTEAQRQLEAQAAEPIILSPDEAQERLGLPVDDGSGVPAHVDAGMLIDGAEMNRKRSVDAIEPADMPSDVPNAGRVPRDVDAGMLFDRLQHKLPVEVNPKR